MTDRPSLGFVCASNNSGILRANLLRSPVFVDARYPLEVIEHASSAATAYNRGLDQTEGEIIVFVHHDVYLPAGWDALLQRRIAEITAHDPDWALIGAYGLDGSGKGFGPIWSSSLGHIVGHVAIAPIEAQSFDEVLLVLRRSTGLRFDEALPGFHLHGTDIVAQAQSMGRRAWVMPLPLVHNDGFKDQLDDTFAAAYQYLQRKWRDRLPIRSPTIKISRTGHQLWRTRWRNAWSRDIRKVMAVDTAQDPVMLAETCGWRDLTPAAAR